METSVAIVCALASVESTRLTAKSTCARLDMTFFAHCNKLLILLVKKAHAPSLGTGPNGVVQMKLITLIQ